MEGVGIDNKATREHFVPSDFSIRCCCKQLKLQVYRHRLGLHGLLPLHAGGKTVSLLPWSTTS